MVMSTPCRTEITANNIACLAAGDRFRVSMHAQTYEDVFTYVNVSIMLLQFRRPRKANVDCAPASNLIESDLKQRVFVCSGHRRVLMYPSPQHFLSTQIAICRQG